MSNFTHTLNDFDACKFAFSMFCLNKKQIIFPYKMIKNTYNPIVYLKRFFLFVKPNNFRALHIGNTSA